MKKEQLIASIERLKPWYQRIDFPEFGISTTDKESWALIDKSPDNLFPGMTSKDASIMRPVSKWNYIKEFLPIIKNKKNLEVGCNCGFFSYEFAKLGANEVYGLDLHITPNALFARKMLGLQNKVFFIEGDFLTINHPYSPLIQDRSSKENILPDVDIVFVASVLTHVGYPFLAMHKMLHVANEFLIIDEIAIGALDGKDLPVAFFVWNEDDPCHSFGFSISMFRKFFMRLGVPEKNMEFNLYPSEGVTQPTKVCLVIDTKFDKNKIKPFHP